MKRIVTSVILVFFASAMGVSATGPTQPELPYMDTGPEFTTDRDFSKVPIQVGESIRLRATYLGLTAGYITITTNSGTIGNRPLYKLSLKARTGGMVEYLYTLEDRFTSYFDRKGLFSWGYDYHQLHNGENETRTVRYNHRGGYFTKNGERKSSIKKYTQDLLSTLYYVRAQDLSEKKRIEFPLQSDDESYDVTLEINRDARVATKDGWVDSYEIRPILDKSLHKEAAREHVESISGIRIWLSKDDRRVPLKISFPATFGHLSAFLEEYRVP
ncbi:MAG: DUF3108 domain-containing protein [bacterium]